MLDNAPNQPTNFRTKNITYNTNSQFKFKTSMLKSSLCDYNDAYTLFKRTITMHQCHYQQQNQIVIITRQYLKNCAPFTDCISEINNTQIDNAK